MEPAASPPAEKERRFDPAPFQVDPTLRGLPLASYGRRLTALLIDLSLIALLTQSGSLTLSTLLALITLWVCVRGARRWWSRILRAGAGLVAGFLVFLIVLSLTWTGPTGFYSPDFDWDSFGAAMMTADPEAQAEALRRLEADLSTAYDEDDVLEALESFGLKLDTKTETEPSTPPARDEVIAHLEEQLAVLKADAGDASDAETVDAVRESLQPWVAGAELEAARAERKRLIQRLGELQKTNLEQKEQLDNPSFKYTFQALAADLGLTMGWAGLYFTLFLALAGGRTPGKWIMRLRVARVDGSPLSTWSSFERFAGYAAGLATGLLGFLQIFWDRNGQTVQDTIAGTVVLDDRKSPKSGATTTKDP